MKKVFPKKNIVIRNILSNLKGEGVLEDTPYSFPYTNIGDEVIFEERGRGKRKHFVVSAIIRKKEIQPKCSHFTHCGGCAGQHFSYEEQFELKTNFYKEKIFNEFSITPILISANKEYNYRNRMDFAVFPGKIVGLHQAGNFRKIIDIEHCHLQNDFANNELTKFKNTLHNFPEIIYNRKTEEGFLKYITFRRGVFSSDNIAILTFVKGFENTNEFTKLKSAILQSLESKNIVFCFNRKKAEVSASGEFIAIRGNHFYEEILFEKVFKIPFDSFFQPNPKGFLPILQFIKDKIKSEKKILVDLFCGSGFFSRIFGENFLQIYGFDFTESSIQEGAKILKEEFPEKHIQLKCTNLFSVQIDFFERMQIPDKSLLILDPPRNGAGKNLSTIIRDSNFEEIFYISCNPKTQLEDLKIITESFQLKEFILTDPYPQTPHIESIAYLQKKI